MAQSNQFASLALAMAMLALSVPVFAQQAKLPSNPFSSLPVAPPAAKPSPSVPPAQTAPISLLALPAKQAQVTLTAGQLTVKADNSTLAEILDQIAKAGDMKVDGLQTSANSCQRIFGDYGPGAPREVLSELLDGCGYNVMMLGKTAAGTPKELTLTSRTPGGVPNPPAQSAAMQNESYRQDYAVQPTSYPQPVNDAQPVAQPEHRGGVRTPQEILQELEQMRQRQQGQQQNQQN